MTVELLWVLAIIESGNRDVVGDGGRAVGPFQLHEIAVREANRVLELKGFPPGFYVLDDRHDYWMARSVTAVVSDYWQRVLEKRYGCVMDAADLVALHRHGPTQWRPECKMVTELDRRRTRQCWELLRKKVLDYGRQ